MFKINWQPGRRTSLAFSICTLVACAPFAFSTETEESPRISTTNNASGKAIITARGLSRLSYSKELTYVEGGAVYRIIQDQVFDFGDGASWIGRADDRSIAVIVTESPLSHEVSVHRSSETRHRSIPKGLDAGYGQTNVDSETTASAHSRAVRLAIHEASRARVHPVNGRIIALEGSNIGWVKNGQLNLSRAFVETLELVSAPNFQAASEPGPVHNGQRSRHYQQYIHGVPVRSLVRVDYDGGSGRILSIDGPIFLVEETPTPPRDDVSAAEAEKKLRVHAVRSYRIDSRDGIRMSAPKREYIIADRKLLLGWSSTMQSGPNRVNLFLDVRSGEILESDATRYHRTCSANGTAAIDCDDADTTLVIDTNDQCVSGTSTSRCTNHETVLDDVKEALADYSARNPGGASVPTDIDILLDAQLSTGTAGAQDYQPDGTPYIRVGQEGTVTQQTSAHEAAHVWMGAKVPSIRPDPGEDEGESALAEGLAYGMDALHRDDLGSLNWPGAHVDDFDPDQPPGVNSEPLQRAIYELVTDSSGFPQSDIYKVVVRAAGRLPNTNLCIGEQCFDLVRETMRDVIEEMADDDEISGSTKTAWKNEVNTAFGKVGLGPNAQPSSTPPPTTPPSAVLIIATEYVCLVVDDSPVTRWTVEWVGQPAATFYEVFDTPPPVNVLDLPATDTAFWLWMGSGASTSTFVKACNQYGCSVASNTLTLSYKTQCDL